MAKIIIDTNVFISIINDEADSSASRELLDKVDSGELKAIVSTITLAELAEGYYQVDDEKGWMQTLQHIISSYNYTLIELDYKVADKAGRIRVETGLSLPDSIIVASGLIGRAEYIVTYDKETIRASKYLKSVTPIEMRVR